MSKSLSLLAGASLLAFAGAASAGEPIWLSDTQMDGVTAGDSALYPTITNNLNSKIVFDKTISGKDTLTVDKTFTSVATATGNAADSTSKADASGLNTLTQTFNQTNATAAGYVIGSYHDTVANEDRSMLIPINGSSTSVGQSISVATNTPAPKVP